MLEKNKVLVLGAGGRLGASLLREYAHDCKVVGYGRGELDITQSSEVAKVLETEAPSIVINAAAMTNVDLCEVERDLAERVNAGAPGEIAKACRKIDARLIHISTDYVFSGEKDTPYDEEDEALPLSWYGQTKRAGEQAVLSEGNSHCVVRVSWVFGPDRDSFIDKALQAALRGETVKAVADKFSSPAYTRDIAEALRALTDPMVPGGIYHACNSGACSWREWAQTAIDAAIADGIEVPIRAVEPIKLSDLTVMVAERPIYTVMSCRKLESLMGHSMRPWQEAVADYVRLLIADGRLR